MKRDLFLMTVLSSFLTLCPNTQSMEGYDGQIHEHYRPLVNPPSRMQHTLSLSMIPEPAQPDIFSPDRVTGQATDLQVAMQASWDLHRSQQEERQFDNDLEAALEASRKEEARRRAEDLVAESLIARDAEEQFRRKKEERVAEKKRLVEEILKGHSVLVPLWETYQKAKLSWMDKISAYSRNLTVHNKSEMEEAQKLKVAIESRTISALLSENKLISDYFNLSSTKENPKQKATLKYLLARSVLDQMTVVDSINNELERLEPEVTAARGDWISKLRASREVKDDSTSPLMIEFRVSEKFYRILDDRKSDLQDKKEKAIAKQFEDVKVFFTFMSERNVKEK